MGIKQEVEITFANDLSRDVAMLFKKEVFNEHLKNVAPENQEIVVQRLIDEGLIRDN